MEKKVISGTINKEWLSNILENIKNLEQLERLAREGCITIFDYFNSSYEERLSRYADIQYKNLRMMVTEFDLLLTDLSPIYQEELEDYTTSLKKLKEVLGKRHLFVKESLSVDKRIKKSQVTEFFLSMVDYISEMKRNLYIVISEILFVKKTDEY